MWRCCGSSAAALRAPDAYGARVPGTQRLVNELTVRAGKVVYDLNGISIKDGGDK